MQGPFDGYEWTSKEVQIIKAAWNDPSGQDALRIIVERLGVVDGVLAHSDASVTYFNLGRRWVGNQIAEALRMPVEHLSRMELEESQHGTHTDSSPVISTTERARRAAAEHINRGKR